MKTPDFFCLFSLENLNDDSDHDGEKPLRGR